MSATDDLVQRAQSGDDDARSELFERFQGRVLALVRKKLGPGLRAKFESMDIAQSAMTAAVRDLDQFDASGDGALIKWLAGVVEHKIRNKAREAGQLKRDAGPERALGIGYSRTSAPRLDPVARGTTPSAHAERDEEATLTRDAIRSLPRNWREIIELRMIQQLPWSAVAGRLGVTEKAAQGRLARAKTELAVALAKLDRG